MVPYPFSCSYLSLFFLSTEGTRSLKCTKEAIDAKKKSQQKATEGNEKALEGTTAENGRRKTTEENITERNGK
jgi:hypothetical protein